MVLEQRRGKSLLSDNHLNSSNKMAKEAIATIRELFPEDLHSRLFLVGGSVRDHLIGQPICDVDLVTDLPAKQLQELGFHLVQGKSTAPIYFKSHPLYGKLEVTILEQGQSLEDNLRRRDFRCNAIAMALDGTITDPFGGQKDIQDRLLSPSSEMSLDNDPMRVFRAFRFECYGWQLSTELVAAIKKRSWEELLSTIPVERFSREMIKAMEGKQPDIFFSRMVEFGVGRWYFPELFRMLDIPAGPAKYHGEDTVFSHSLDTLRRMTIMTDNPTARLAAFLHDLGKLATPDEMLPRHIGHDKAGESMSGKICSRLKLPSTCCCIVASANALHLVAGRWSELKPATKLKLARKSLKSCIATWLPLIVSADRNIDNPMPGWDLVCHVAGMSATDLGITPNIFDNIPPSERQRLIDQGQIKRYTEIIKITGVEDK